MEFRVAAENAAGVGEPSESSSYARIEDPIYPPGKTLISIGYSFTDDVKFT